MLKLCLFAVMICCSNAQLYCKLVGSTIAKFYDESKTWDEARAFCVSEGGDLLCDTTEGTHDFIDMVNERLWIGGTDAGHEGEWEWVNGESIDTGAGKSYRWAWGEPNNQKSNQHCMTANYDGHHWDDDTCSKPKKFACEFKPEGTIVDNYAVVRHYEEQKTYGEALTACEIAGGMLVAPDNDETIEFLRTTGGTTWVGATDVEMEGEWIMTNGDVLSTDSPYWSAGAPDNADRVEHCAIFESDGLDDRYCKEQHSYACQFAVCR